jgi:hypothetical protein
MGLRFEIGFPDAEDAKITQRAQKEIKRKPKEK